MSVDAVLQRVALLQQAQTNPALLLSSARENGGAPAAPAAEPADAPAGATFAEALQSASSGPALSSATAPSTTTALPGALPGVSGLSSLGLSPSLGVSSQGTGARMVAIAESQIGQAEQPPGSNESPAIAEYRTATAGAEPGAPWCAYFASWVARQAGAPLGPSGEGLGAVGEIWSWAQSTGRAIPNGPGVVPEPGDLIVFGDQHVGIVKGVLPNGEIQTIEGNYSNKVSANVRSASEATGYVKV
jgi:CHAP domain